jgi:molybdopterin-guanine dinucleotide biosynthesis protein A
MAVASALAATVHDFLLVVPVDLPELPLPLLRRLLRAARDGACVAVPVVRGLYEPLFAVYPRSVLGEMERLLASGSRRIVDLFERVPVRCLDIDEGLRNLNTPEDWQAWIAGLEGKERAPGSL